MKLINDYRRLEGRKWSQITWADWETHSRLTFLRKGCTCEVPDLTLNIITVAFHAMTKYCVGFCTTTPRNELGRVTQKVKWMQYTLFIPYFSFFRLPSSTGCLVQKRKADRHQRLLCRRTREEWSHHHGPRSVRPICRINMRSVK